MDEQSNITCSLCWKPGVNFIRGKDIVNLKEYLAFYEIFVSLFSSQNVYESSDQHFRRSTKDNPKYVIYALIKLIMDTANM